MFTCIIPIYNEQKSTLSLVETLRGIDSINEIICIDSCSENDTADMVKKSFPEIKLIKMVKNLGKAEAVFKGTESATNEDILLMDADLININAEEIKKALSAYAKDKTIDMIIMKNYGPNRLMDSIFRNDIFLSGKRILKKTELLKIKLDNPSGYQLEVAINDYMLRNSKNVYWIENSAINPHKVQKFGFAEGMLKDLKMEISLVSFVGVRKYLQQILFFCRREIK
jgi:glycosyltransferase involved in cell wall biosynthesis